MRSTASAPTTTPRAGCCSKRKTTRADLERTPARLALLGILAIAAAQLVAFALVDRRPPNDHDGFFAVDRRWTIEAFDEADPLEKARILGRHLVSRETGHPQLAQTWLIAFAGTVGFDRTTLRLSNLPFLLLMVIGMALAGRELGDHRLALMAAFLAATLPVVVHMSRKWFIHFHAAALVPLGLAAALYLLRRGPDSRWGWVALGAALGIRAHAHPITLPDAALTWVLVGGLLLRGCRSRRESSRPVWIGLSLSAAVGLVVASPQLVSLGWTTDEGNTYAGHMARYVMVSRWLDGGLAVVWSDLGDTWALVWHHHWTPALAVLVLIPGLLLSLVGLASERGSGIALLLGLVLPQIVAAAFVVGNAAYLADWLHLELELVLLCAAAVDGALEGGLRRAWVTVTVAVGLALVTGPLLASWSGPDPLEHPEAYDGWLGGLVNTEHGGPWRTHHLLVRTEQLGQRLADAVADTSGPPSGSPSTHRPVGLGTADLTWESAPGCRPGPAGWTWGLREPSPVIPSFELVQAGWAPEVGPIADQRVAVVRLWLGVDGAEPCDLAPELRRGILEEATAEVRARFGRATVQTVIDVPELAVGNQEPRRNPTPGYAKRVLLVVR